MIAIRRHSSRTSSTMCVERMTITSSPISDSRFEKAVALVGIEAGGRLVDDDQLRPAGERDRDAESLLHAAGESADALSCARPRGSSA